MTAQAGRGLQPILGDEQERSLVLWQEGPLVQEQSREGSMPLGPLRPPSLPQTLRQH